MRPPESLRAESKNRRGAHDEESPRSAPRRTRSPENSSVEKFVGPTPDCPPGSRPHLLFAKSPDRSRAFGCCGTTSQIFAMKAPHLRTVAREGTQPSAVDSVWNKKHRLHGKDRCPPPQRF